MTRSTSLVRSMTSEMPSEHDIAGGARTSALTARVVQMAPPILRTQRLTVRMAEQADIPLIISYFKQNELHLSKSGPAPVANFLTDKYWQAQIAQNDLDFQSDK